MEGIQILNTIQVQVPSTLSEIGLVLLLLCVFLAIISLGCEEYRLMITFLVAALVGFAFMCCSEGEEVKTRYEVTIDKSVSYLELTERYNIIEQRGELFVIEAKQSN